MWLKCYEMNMAIRKKYNEKEYKQMKKIFDLTPEEKMWLTKQLEELNLSEKYIWYIMNTSWFEFCTDIDELDTMVRIQRNLEFENLEELYDYLCSPDSKGTTLLYDEDSGDEAFLVYVDTIYKSGDAEIKTSDQFGSLKDFYNHLGKSYRKNVSYETFIKHWCFDCEGSWCTLINDNGQKFYMDFFIEDGTVTILHIGDVNCGSDKEMADRIELHHKV